MKTTTHAISTHLYSFGLLILAACLLFAPPARAGLTVDIHLYHDTYGYYFYPWLNANTNTPDFPTGNYMIASPQIPSNGSQLQYQATNNTLTFTGGGGNYYGDFNSFLYGITNGQWSIWVTNTTSTNQYNFTVTVTGVTSNSFGAPAVAVFPTTGAQFVTNQPLFQWTGPANWAGTLNVNDDFIDANGNYNYEASASLPPNQTSWPCPAVLPNGTNDFSVDYGSNVTAMIIASTPTNGNAQPIAGWVSTSTLETHFTYDPQFIVGTLQGQADRVVNGGFETGDFTGWIVTGGGGGIFVDDGSGSGITPHSGIYEAALGTGGALGYLSQTLPTTAGASYLLSFWLNSPDGATPNEFQVSWNGTTLFDETDLPALGWTNIQFVVTATGPSAVLQFGAQDDPSYLALDDVSVVPTQAGSSGGHTNVAHYAFDNSGNLGQDSSSNGNDMSGPTAWGPTYQFDPDAEAGAGAVQFFGTSALYAYGQTLTNLNAVLAGSFTVSAWVKTTVSNGADYNNAFYGATIFWAYNDQGNTNDTIPLSITGSKAAFTTRDHLGNFDTLHSISSVNDGNYHLITVTRDQASGEKKIYVDGNFETSEIGTTDPLNGNNYNLTIGGWAYCTDGNCTNFYAYNGLLDDVQIYTGVLSDAEVASLYANPGNTVPDVAGGPPGGPVVHYDFDEGTVLAADVSGNNNNIVHAGNFGGSGPSISTDTAAGAGSVSFDGGSYLTASSNLLSTLAGEFSVSLWLKTSQSFGSQNDYAWAGAGVIAADSPNAGAQDLIPVALTGGQVAFNVGDGISDNTLNSSATVNDNTWHHVVVTRSLSTGARQIFIDGTLDSSDVASTVLLNSPVLLTIGAKSDASDPDPASPSYNGSNGYEGLLDDVQIYNRVLSSNEVAFLYQNPGATVTNSSSTPYPVDVNLQFGFIRSQDPNLGEIYGASVSFNSVSPAPTTTNSVRSPNDYFSTEQYPGGGSGSGAILSSLGDVLNEFTNGLWKIYINQDSPTQQVYSFQVSISGLDTNLLKAVKVFLPTNGAVNIATNPAFYWVGPSNFTTLQIELLSGPVAFPPVTATNWPSAPTVSYGTNRFDVDYNSNNFPGVTFTTPVDASSNPVRTWTTTVNLTSEAFDNFVVGAPAPLPVLITNLARAGGNLQFSFQTLAGRPHTVQARTNLTLGAWVNLTNFTGDGSLRQFIFPVTNPPVRFFRVDTQ
jgi:hypothetical protein